MKRTFLRVVSMCLAVLMLVGVANLSVFATQPDTENNAATLQSAVRANVARNGSVVEVNERQILAEIYAGILSAEEKAVLASDALIGASYTFTKPADCIQVDADAKKVTAQVVAGDGEHDWIPKRARVLVNGVPVGKDVPIVNGEASFAGLTATSWTAEVDYELELSVEDELELLLVNAAANLYGAKKTFDKITELKSNLDMMIEATFTLEDEDVTVKPLEELYNITYKNGGIRVNDVTYELAEGPTADAIIVLHDEVVENEGYFDLHQYIVAYEEANNKVEYILNNGQDMMDALKATRDAFADLCIESSEDPVSAPYTALNELIQCLEDELLKIAAIIDKALEDIKGYEEDLSDPTLPDATRAYIEGKKALLEDNCDKAKTLYDDVHQKVEAFKLAMRAFDAMYKDMAAIGDDYAVAYTDPVVRPDATDTELKELDDAVNQIPAIIDRHGLSSKQVHPLIQTLQGTVQQSIVSVDVIAHVWENGVKKTVGLGEIDASFIVDIGVTGDVVTDRIVTDSIAATTALNKGWTNESMYGVNGTNYTLSYRNIPDVVEDHFTCILEYSPKSFAITCDFDGIPESAEYGEYITMPFSTVEGTSYTYTVTDQDSHTVNRLEGETYTVKSAVTVEREKGMAMGDPVTIPTFIANSTIPGAALTAKDRDVLKQAAIIGSDSTIKYGVPESGVSLRLTGGTEGSYEYTVSAITHTTTLAYKANAEADAKVGSGKWVPVEVKYVDNGVNKSTPFGGAASVVVKTTTPLTGVDVVYRLAFSQSENAWWLANAEITELATLADVLSLEAKNPAAGDNDVSEFGQVQVITKIKTLLAEYDMLFGVAMGEEGALVSLLRDYATKNPEGAAKAQANYDSLAEKCFNGKKPKIVAELNKYGETEEDILIYYYTENHSEILIKLLTDLQSEYSKFIEDEDFLDYLSTSSFAGTVNSLKTSSGTIKSFTMIPVNARINRSADETSMGKLVASLLADGKTTASVAAFDNLYYDTIVSESYEGYADLTISVGGVSTKIPYYKEDFFDIDDVQQLENAILNLMQKVEDELGAAVKYYKAPEYQNYLPDVGDNVAAYLESVNNGFELEYTPIQYHVTINGSDDVIPAVTYNGSNTELLLPTPTTKASVYTYFIAGVEIPNVAYNKAGNPKKIKLGDYGISFDQLFTSTNVTIDREVLNVTDVNFQAFVDAMNAAFRSANADISFIPTYDILRPVDADTEYRYGLILRVGAGATSMSLDAMQKPLLDALGKYDSISFEDQTFFNGSKISVQSLINLVANSGLSMDGIYSMIDNNGAIINNTELQTLTPMSGSLKNVGGLIMTNTMTLERELDDEDSEVFHVALYTSLSGSSSQLLAVKKAIGTVKNYVNLSADEGVFDLHLDMPDKLYPYYMSAMVLLDQTQFENIQTGMDLQTTMDYYKGMVGDLTGKDNFSTETIENTLAELGKNVDLSTYADTFNKVKKVINFLLDETAKENGQVKVNVIESTHKNYKASAECAAEPLFDRLPEKIRALMDILVLEAASDSKLDFTFNVTIEDREVNYTAMVFDNSKSGLNKFYYTADLTSALSGLGNNSIVVLMNDATLDADVTIPNNAFINLNGFTINGNLKTSARVTISDSTLHTTGDSVGGVNGSLSGNFIITGGKYSQVLTDSMLKAGYQQVDGYVSNIFYTFEDDGEGNITVNIPADILSKTTIPEIKALAVDIAMDVAFNLYNAATLYVDDSLIYSFETEDLLTFASMSGREIADELINKLDQKNVKALAKQIYTELMDFDNIAANINTPDGVIANYALTTYGWAFGFGVSDRNAVRVDLVPGEEKNRSFSIAVVGTPEEKALLSDLFTEIDKSLVTFTPSIDYFKVSYSGGLKVDYSAALDVAIDLSHNNNYGALMIAAVASATDDPALKTVLANYLADASYTNISAMATALENIKLSQFIKGLKHLKNVDCATMLSNLGVSSEDIVALEEIYGDLIYITAVLLERLDITGGDQMLKYYKIDDFASYDFGPETVKNITITLALSLLDAEPEIIPDDYEPVVSITVTPEKSEYGPDEQIKWIITVNNTGADAAKDVVVYVGDVNDRSVQVAKFDLPAINGSWSGNYETNAADATSLKVWVEWKDGDEILDDDDDNWDEASAEVTLRIPDPDQQPLLEVTLTADKTEYTKNDTITWKVTVTNVGNIKATDIVITDLLAGLNLPIPELDVGETYGPYEFNSNADRTPSITNTVTVTYKNGETQYASHTVNVEDIPAPPVVDVTLTADKTEYTKNDTITWKVTVTNVGNIKATDIVITDLLAGLNLPIPELDVGETYGPYEFNSNADRTPSITNQVTVTYKNGETKYASCTVSVKDSTTPGPGPGPGPDPIVPTPSTPTKPVIREPKVNVNVATKKILGVETLTMDMINYLLLDIHVEGMTVKELIESLNISATGSRVELQTSVTNTKTVNGEEIIVSGSVLTITASNSAGKTSKEYVIVIDGDVNCDGYVDTADAIYMAWHYCDIVTISDPYALVAANGNNRDKDIHADDAMRIVFKYLHWTAGDDRYVSQ